MVPQAALFSIRLNAFSVTTKEKLARFGRVEPSDLFNV
jgi:hypothetical protein